MRSFRIAAVAGVSALAMTFGSISAVSAEEATLTEIQQGDNTVPVEPAPEEQDNSVKDENGTLSSKINNGLNLDGDQAAQGPAIFGSSKDMDSQPTWAKLLYAGTILGAIGTFIGAIVGPIHNFIVHGPQA